MERRFRVRIGDREYIVDIEEIGKVGEKTSIHELYTPSRMKVSTLQLPTSLPRVDKNTIVASISGRVLCIRVREGDIVRKGDVLAEIESMKTNIRIQSDRDGIIDKVFIKEGDFVRQGSPMFRILPKSIATFGLEIADRFLAGLAILNLCRNGLKISEVERLITSKFSIKKPGLRVLISSMKLANLIEERDGKLFTTEKGIDRLRELSFRLIDRLRLIGVGV